MEKDRQTKIITILALFIGISVLTLGFAVFSTQLAIQSRATATPDEESFKVVLSKEQDKETVGTIAPIGEGEEATISNTSTPMISNLKANFVNPGEKVIYEFYAVNLGEFDAYLNKINYENIDSQAINKICTAGEGTTDEYVQSACESIRVTIKVGEDDKACQTSTYATHSLVKDTGEKVVVTIEYDKEGARADGPFEVEFGNITLNYSTVDTETKNVPACPDYDTQIVVDPFATAGKMNIYDADGDGRISLSDKVTLGAESFYVMSTDEVAGTVTMLAEWNLNVGVNMAGDNIEKQSSTCKGYDISGATTHCTVAFSGTNYWSGTVSSYPALVYNENSGGVRPYVNKYVDGLIELGYSSATGRLISYEELISLGCSASENTCNSAPSWVYDTSYWTGSAGSDTTMWHVTTDGSFAHNNTYSSINRRGIRPVITINASEI